jgi:hypothetical protein
MDLHNSDFHDANHLDMNAIGFVVLDPDATLTLPLTKDSACTHFSLTRISIGYNTTIC